MRNYRIVRRGANSYITRTIKNTAYNNVYRTLALAKGVLNCYLRGLIVELQAKSHQIRNTKAKDVI